MTIDQAITRSETRAKDLDFRGYKLDAQAIKLGIEAMTRLEVYRARHPELIWELLEGETQK